MNDGVLLRRDGIADGISGQGVDLMGRSAGRQAFMIECIGID